MKLSIITINYNNCEGLKKTIESVVSQSCRYFEYIVIDGGSSDGSKDIIAQFSDKIDYWISEPDHGIYNAMNKGISNASGEYLVFMNSGDCICNSNTIAQILPHLGGIDIYVGDIINDLDCRQQLVQFPRTLSPQIILDQIVFRFIPHQASFIRRDLFERLGLYREDLRIASDWYFFYNAIVMHGASIECIPETIAIFDMTGISNRDTQRIDERILSQRDIPCQQNLFCFYRDNAEIMNALKSTFIGRTFIRIYFYIYRKFKAINY